MNVIESVVFGGIGYSILGGVVFGAEAGCLAVPSLCHSETALFTPFTNLVHSLALDVPNEFVAHGIQVLHYIAKPVDRIIQAIASPIFLLFAMYKFCKLNPTPMIIVGCVLFSPMILFLSVIQAIGLLLNAASQLICPFQTLYAVIKGKEAAREYFDYRQEKIKDLTGDAYNDAIKNQYYTPILPERKDFESPKCSWFDLNHPSNSSKLDDSSSSYEGVALVVHIFYKLYTAGAFPLLFRMAIIP
jgi:hypothetical protein